MSDNFAPSSSGPSDEELLALEGYTPERLAAFRDAADAKIKQAHAQAQARASKGTAAIPDEQERQAKTVTVLLGNGKLINFKGIYDLDFGSKNPEGFEALFLLGEGDQVVAQFEPTTWAAYYYTEYCRGLA